MPYTYEYPRPAVTVDVAVFGRRRGALSVLLIERKHEPFKGAWALPGGFVDKDEALEVAAARELREETGVTGLALTQVGAFGTPGRDPRGHTVSVAFVTLANPENVRPEAGDDAARAEWHDWEDLELGDPAATSTTRQSTGQRVRLAVDHDQVLLAAKAKLDRIAT